jgi:hypothetical protein
MYQKTGRAHFEFLKTVCTYLLACLGHSALPSIKLPSLILIFSDQVRAITCHKTRKSEGQSGCLVIRNQGAT